MVDIKFSVMPAVSYTIPENEKGFELNLQGKRVETLTFKPAYAVADDGGGGPIFSRQGVTSEFKKLEDRISLVEKNVRSWGDRTHDASEQIRLLAVSIQALVSQLEEDPKEGFESRLVALEETVRLLASEVGLS